MAHLEPPHAFNEETKFGQGSSSAISFLKLSVDRATVLIQNTWRYGKIRNQRYISKL